MLLCNSVIGYCFSIFSPVLDTLVFLFFVIVCMIFSNFLLIRITPVKLQRELFPGDKWFFHNPWSAEWHCLRECLLLQWHNSRHLLKAVVYNRLVIHVLYWWLLQYSMQLYHRFVIHWYLHILISLYNHSH